MSSRAPRLALLVSILAATTVLSACASGDRGGTATVTTRHASAKAAVSGPTGPTQAATTSAPTGPSAPGASRVPMSLPEGITEAEFKALHAPPKDAPAAPKGTTIDLAGTRAYLSLPEGATAPVPGVVVIHEWWGLNDNVRHWADRLATEGYAAIAVDLYGGKVADSPDDALAAMDAVDPEKALATLLAAHAFLKDDPRIQAPRRASIGWCFGGGWSLQLAMNAPDLEAAVIYYGRLVTEVDQLRSIRASILGVFGSRDTSITPEHVEAFELALGAAGVERRILRYDADHAFANPSAQGRYDEPSAAAAWSEVRQFLAQELKGP